jgi:hypothetical protein
MTFLTLRSLFLTRRLLRAGVLLIGAACFDSPTAPDGQRILGDEAPKAEVRVTAQSGKFLFLPPLVKQSSYTGESDPAQKPTVMVCAIADNNGSKSCGDIVGYFTTSNGTGAEIVRYDPIEQEYKVNWKTSTCPSGSCTLDLEKTYRIRVLIGTIELGFTDVLFVSSAAQLKNSSGEVTALMDRGTLPIKFRIEKGVVAVVAEGASALVGTEGGKIASVDGDVGLSIPAGAVTSSESITIQKVEDAPGGLGVFSPVVDLGPDGTTFATPVDLSLKFDPEKLPPGVAPEALGVYTLRDGAWEAVPDAVVSEIDNTVTVAIEHFSVYGVSLRPNNVSGDGTPTELNVGERNNLSSVVYGHHTVPRRYCYTGYFGRTTCKTYLEHYYYPLAGIAVDWMSSAPGVFQFSSTRSFTNSQGQALSPIGQATSPGLADITATSGGLSSSPVRFTVIGHLDIVPGSGELIAGWRYGLRLLPRVPGVQPAEFSLVNLGSMEIAQSGTTDYVWDDGKSFVMPSGAEGIRFDFSDAHLGADTLHASGKFFRPTTAVFRFVKGKLLVSGWPAALTVGDSVPLTLSVADQSGAITGDLAQPARFVHKMSAGLVVVQGQPTSEISIASRTSDVYYLKAVASGAQAMRIEHPFYDTFEGGIEVKPLTVSAPVIDPDPQAGHQFVVATSPGIGKTQSTIINNAGAGSLRNMKIKGAFVANCYNGQQVNWITASFTEGVVPVVMHLTVAPPPSFPNGEHDFCYTLSADGAADRSYGVRLRLQPAVPEFETSKQLWDANPEFPAVVPFQGTWSAGRVDSLGAAFVPFPQRSVGPGEIYLHDPTTAYPFYIKTFYTVTVEGIPPGGVALHPACETPARAVLRWTAPARGVYSTRASFLGGGGGVVSIHVLKNNDVATPQFFRNKLGTQVLTYDGTLELDAGATLDFVVGSYDNCISDMTPVDIQIRRVWDIAVDFPVPGVLGPWSSGRTATLGAAFVRDDKYGPGPGEIYWGGGTSFPYLIKNLSALAHGIPTNYAALHPGCEKPDYAVLRWTAPQAGSYLVHGKFLAGHSGAVSTHVLRNGLASSPLLAVPVTFSDQALPANTTLSLAAGETLDFVVGNAGDCNSDSTPLEVRVTRQ